MTRYHAHGSQPTDPTKPAFCATCRTYDWNEQHICVDYTGQPCAQCGEPTLIAQIGAPGYGTVRVCRAGHEEELTPCGILDIWAVM